MSAALNAAPIAAARPTPDLPALPASLRHEQADAYVQRCRVAIERSAAPDAAAAPAPAGAVWPLDAAALQHFDSAALAALLAVSRLVRARGGRLQVQQMPLRLRELATLYGVSELLAA